MATQVIAGGLSAIGSILGGKGQKKAANKAAEIVANSSREANTLTREIYDRNVGYISPWLGSGQTANNAYMELLGFAPPVVPQPSAFGVSTGTGTSAYPYAFGGPAADGTMGGMGVPSAFEGFTWDEPGVTYGRLPRRGYNQQYGPAAPATAAPPGAPAPSARSAFDTYKGSTGYDFRFNEGIRALQSAFSRNRESGAADKAAIRFGQGIGSDEFGRYMDLLRGQSQLGFGSASALAGVGQNFADTVNSSSRLAAEAAANARLYSGQQNAAMWQNLGSSFGQAVGAFPGFKIGGW